MDASYAMNYEYLIRRCHQVERYGNKCADVDDFKALEQLLWEKSNLESSGDNFAKVDRQFRKKLDEISGCVIKAIDTAKKKHGSVLSEHDHSQLSSFIGLLNEPNFETLCQVIIKTEKILIGHQIYPG